MGKLLVLVAPLDWGLGHTTRCLPIIKAFVDQGTEVYVAGTETQKRVILSEFPTLVFLDLAGYEIGYSRSRWGFTWTILKQFPKILKAIKTENEWLQKAISEYQLDLVISDNRFGLYSAKVPCIFITHQLSIKSKFGKWSERILQKWNYKWINRFSACWVPDKEERDNLAGDLAHPLQLPATPVSYIGPLSRFEKTSKPVKANHLLVILSGPEPQRTILEDKIVNSLVHYQGTADVVRGLPTTEKFMPSTNQLHFYNHLAAGNLNEKIMEAEFVISRCGYSTVMDLVKLNKKGILVPTPGQTEQEYLARYLTEKKIAYCVSQDKFSLEKDIAEATCFEYRFPALNESSLKIVIDDLLVKQQ